MWTAVDHGETNLAEARGERRKKKVVTQSATPSGGTKTDSPFMMRGPFDSSGLAGCMSSSAMDAGRGARGSPGGRPPPKRTYGSKQGSRRGLRPTDGQHPAPAGQGNSAAEPSKHLPRTTAPLPEPTNGRINTSKADGTRGLLLQQSAGRYGGAVGGGMRSAEEISQLVNVAGQGGESGRTAAIALAQACKSRETRKAMRTNAGCILSELTSALSVSLETEGGDEALVHGLAVAMFILSKDRALVKAFSASTVSTLAVLIEGKIRHDSAVGDSFGARSGAAAASSAAATAVRRGKSASFVRTLGTIDEKNSSNSSSGSSSSSSRSISALQRKGKVSSPFDISVEDEDDELVGVSGGPGSNKALSGGARLTDPNATRTLHSNGSAPGNTSNLGALPQVRTNHHGSTNVTVRTRMLLDIADMVPWGMSNRHLVSAADLGLATLLNVAAQACPESGEKAGGAAGGSAAGESVDEEFSSHSEPSSVGGGSVTGQADGSEATTAHNAGVMPELSRLAPTGFLLPLILGGASVLAGLSAGVRESDAAVDPSSLRSVHQLLLALRLLDLATLENSSHGDGAATKVRENAKSAPDSPSHHSAELTGALLVVIAKCQPLCGDDKLARTEDHGRPKVSASRKGGAGQKQRAVRSPQPVVGKEVAARAHECLLAALRVLINVTHHDARVCEEVASRGGLDTLMSCLVARSFCGTQGSDSVDSNCGSSRSDLALLEEVVNGAGEDSVGTGLEQGGGGSRGEASSGEGDFDAQVLAMSALINCVELKESADNCAAMASLAVHRPATAGPVDERMFGGRRRKQKELLLGVVGDLSSPRCLAPEFLARLLIRCTRSFAHQLEADRPDGDGEEGPASPAPARVQQPGCHTMAQIDSRDGAGVSTALAAAPTAAPAISPAQVTDNGEQLMSHAEGTDLVLGGHCALLLGLLVREQEANRRLALPVLPNGDPTLIVRVLEAFMALQFQAGVLTEEMVLAVQGLVEELEGLEALPVEERNPLDLEVSDEAAAAAEHNTPTASPQRNRKRPRTPSLGEWAGEAGGDSGNADNFTLSVKRPRTDESVGSSRGEEASALWSPCRQATCPAKASKPSVSSSSASTQASPDEQPVTPTPSKSSGSSNACETPPSRKRTPASVKASPSWPVGGTSIAGRIGMGLRGRSAAGTRNWLGGSSRLRTYGGGRSTYRSPTWKRQPSRPLAGLHAPSARGHARKEAAGEQGGGSSRAVFEILSDDSEDETAVNPPRVGVGGDSGGSSSSGVRDSGVGPRSGRDSTVAKTVTSSGFDVDDWSDSSNERPAKKISRKGIEARAARVPTCQLQSLTSRRGSGGGGGANDDGVGPSRRPPSPSPPPAAARAKSRSPSPSRGVGPRSGWSSRGSLVTQPASSATASATITTCARSAIGQRPGQSIGDVASRPPTGRPLKSKEAYERRVGVRPEWSSSPVTIGRQQGKGASGGSDALRATIGSGGSARVRVGGVKEPATRRVLGSQGSDREGKRSAEKTASRSVFDMDDEDDSD